jgi:hypothetical protein
MAEIAIAYGHPVVLGQTRRSATGIPGMKTLARQVKLLLSATDTGGVKMAEIAIDVLIVLGGLLSLTAVVKGSS